jgi:peptide-methionine (S)-S-oxide reductase
MIEKATIGSGCFWCTEAVYTALKGVISAISGYSGGNLVNPTYEQVSGGNTGHAEVIQIEFDNEVVSYEQIVEIFFLTHNPTTLNRQGNDIGTQYRSVIFYHSLEQKQIAEKVKENLEKEKVFQDPIVTEIVKFEVFYPAEKYHQNYFANNPNQPYCQAVINPKVSKFRQKFAHLLKS